MREKWTVNGTAAAATAVLITYLILVAILAYRVNHRPVWDTFNGRLQLSPGMFDPQPLTVPPQMFKRAPAD
jgi:hypothetical protein